MLAHTRGPFYGDVDAPGGLARALSAVTVGGELILLHADVRRLRLLVNLIVQLNGHGIDHVMVLGFTNDTCAALRRGARIGCVTSTYLQSGPLAPLVKARRLEQRFVAWLQRFHLLRRLIEEAPGVRVLACDTDLAVRVNPYASLHSAFREFQLVTTFDFKGGFANTNIGFMYIRNASARGALRGLFVEFERRVALALPLHATGSQRRQHTTKFLWDQNLWNKVLLSDMAGHAVYLPDGSDSAWVAANRRERLRAKFYWREARAPTPSPLRVLPPWGETTERYLWYEMRRIDGGGGGGNGGSSSRDAEPAATAATAAAPPAAVGMAASSRPSQRASRARGVSVDETERGRGTGACLHGAECLPGGGGSGEKVAMAPAWLVAMENGLGLKGKHWQYGATPSPAVLVHYTCTTQTEAARVWPLRLFGHWHEVAVNADAPTGLAAAVAAGGAAAATAPPAAKPPPQLLALVDGTLANPLPATGTSWARLNALHAVLGGLAASSGRTLVAPAINCTGVGGARHLGRPKPGEPGLSGRCFWQVHSRHGARCVLRIGGCEEVATPSEAEAAEAEARAAGVAPPVVTLDLSHTEMATPMGGGDGAGALAGGARGGGGSVGASASSLSAIDALTLPALATSRLVWLRVVLPDDGQGAFAPPPLARGGRGVGNKHAQAVGVGRGLLEHIQRRVAEPRLRVAMRDFRKRCADLTSGPNCNNICS